MVEVDCAGCGHHYQAEPEGDHRVMCGDAADPADLAVLMLATPDAMITDPPYGISIVGVQGTAGNFPGTSAPRHQAIPIEGDDRPFDPRHLVGLARRTVMFGAQHFAHLLPPHGKWLVWDKKDGKFQGSDLGDCELAWTDQDGAARLLHHTWQGMYRAGEGERAPRVHPTQKPVDLLIWCMDQIDAGPIVVDPYAGSGSTLIAAERTGRSAWCMDIEPAYVDVMVARWEAHTGRTARLVAP